MLRRPPPIATASWLPRIERYHVATAAVAVTWEAVVIAATGGVPAAPGSCASGVAGLPERLLVGGISDQASANGP